MLLLLLLGCAGTEANECQPPAEATVPDGGLNNDDDCGHWAVGVDEHLYIRVELTEPDQDCEGETTGSVEQPYAPIYSNLSDSAPKWTFDVLGMEAGEGTLDIVCGEGTTWSGSFTVTE